MGRRYAIYTQCPPSRSVLFILVSIFILYLRLVCSIQMSSVLLQATVLPHPQGEETSKEARLTLLLQSIVHPTPYPRSCVECYERWRQKTFQVYRSRAFFWDSTIQPRQSRSAGEKGQRRAHQFWPIGTLASIGSDLDKESEITLVQTSVAVIICLNHSQVSDRDRR